MPINSPTPTPDDEETPQGTSLRPKTNVDIKDQKANARDQVTETIKHPSLDPPPLFQTPPGFFM